MLHCFELPPEPEITIAKYQAAIHHHHQQQQQHVNNVDSIRRRNTSEESEEDLDTDNEEFEGSRLLGGASYSMDSEDSSL